MEEWLNEFGVPVIAGLLVLVVILLLLQIRISFRLRKLRKQYIAFMDGTGVENLEGVIIGMKESIEQQIAHSASVAERLDQAEVRLASQKAQVGVERYNAYGEQGNDLSFSLALVNDQQDGLVLTGLHNRDSSFIYAKPVEQGKSKYPLTPEEEKAIRSAK